MRRRTKNKAADKISETSYTPPNGPVGADQVNPYEMNASHSANQPLMKEQYSSFNANSRPVGVHEVDEVQNEKMWGRPAAMEVSGQELRSPRSPAPAYEESVMPVEMDGASNARVGSRR
jgi:hypothetical protein